MSRYWRSWVRFTDDPFHSTAPCGVTTILFLIGSIGGGVELLFCGRSSFTAWVWIGMVMISMMISTSMTSINGVVLISIIGSPSELLLVVCIAMTGGSFHE